MIAHSEEYKGRTIEIVYDEFAESPDYWGNEDYFIVYDHRDFTVERKGFDPETIFEHIAETKRMFYEGYWVFPLYAYIHSGVSLSLGQGTDRWDTSYRGFVLVKRQKGWSYTRTRAEKIAQSIKDEWNEYLGGEVYGYDTGSDSCWGFYGDEGMKEAISQAKGCIDHEIWTTIKLHLVQVKKWITNKVPLIYRQPLELSL